MMKKSYLTPILSGVLAVTVVGSGAAYYFNFVKDGGKDADKEEAKDGKSLTVEQAADNIEAQLDKAQQIVSGDYNGGYTAQLSYTPGSGLTSELGSEVGEISVSMDARQKDKLTGLDYAVNYNSQKVISLNAVYDNANEVVYVQIPELSESYLTGTIADIETLTNGAYDDDYYYDEGDYDMYESSAFAVNGMAVNSAIDPDVLASIDFDALFTDLEGYWTVIKENAPQPTDGANKTGEVDGVSYELTTKTYTITAADAAKMLGAVAEKGKADETLKSAMLSMGMTEADYTAMWDELVIDADEAESDDTVIFDAYYSGEDFAGFSLQPPTDSGEVIQIINYSTDTQAVCDWNIAIDDEVLTTKGVVNMNGNVLDGSITANYDGGEDGSTTACTVSYDSLEVTDTTLKGGATVTVNEDGVETKTVMTFNNTESSIDMSIDAESGGMSLGTIKLTAQETDASDVAIPTGVTLYNIASESDLEAYANSLDVESWQASLETTLGSELYDALFGVQYYEDDYDDYDYDDYDDGLNSFGTGVALDDDGNPMI